MAGILLQYLFRFHFHTETSLIILIILFLVCCAVFFLENYAFRWLFGAVLCGFFLFTGLYLTERALIKSAWRVPPESHNYKILLLEDPVDKPRSRMCRSRIAGSDPEIFRDVSEKHVILYLSLDSATKELKAGDGIGVKTVFKKPEMGSNPSFDYPGYLEKQGIAATGFAGRQLLKVQPVSVGFQDWVNFQGLKYQKQIIRMLEKMIPDKENAAVAGALIVGYRSDLNPELRKSFSETGTAHILAVSGLHLAILFSVLSFIFSPLESIPYLRPVVKLSVLLILWGFAFITGLPPSVVRACVMITFINFGGVFGRRSFTLNTLAASAFFMLIYNPLYLFDVGFQLSYGAVLSIILINPYLVGLKEFKSKIMTYFWELTCVSVSAQIGTAPVSLFYFGQFPTIFILANLLTIPVTGVLLVLIPLSVLLYPIPGLPDCMFAPVSALTDLFVSVVKVLNRIPCSVITGIRVDFWSVVSMYLWIYLFSMLLIKRQPHYFHSLALLVILQVIYYLWLQN